MRSFVYTLFLAMITTATASYGCDANCLACHPKLAPNGKYDKNHAILKRCTNCHKEEPGKENHGACGADCWQCHDIQRVGKIDIVEHRVLAQCIQCHASVDKHLFDKGRNPLMGGGTLLENLQESN